MKVLIIGKDSYIGNHIDEWLSKHGHQVEQLDVLNDEWKTYDYSLYDAIVHVAGIVHQPNCQPIVIATMAKKAGVKQYIFFSTMGVYGLEKKLTPNIIDEKTPLNPVGMYGKSKYMAEEGLNGLQDESFNIAIVRPPSVYGKGCRGGYITGFTSIVQKLHVVPCAYENTRQSFIYIDNLSELVSQLVERNLHGVFCPQDDKAVCANELLKAISKGLGIKYRSSRLLGYLLQAVCFIPLVNKAYGGVEYAKELSSINGVDYVVVPFEEGMRRTVSKNE